MMRASLLRKVVAGLSILGLASSRGHKKRPEQLVGKLKIPFTEVSTPNFTNGS